MWDLEIGFDRPGYLWLLVLLPLLWFFSFRSLAGLGNLRRVLALSFRSLVLLLIVFALAEMQLQRVSEKVTTIYLLDQSESIPTVKRELMWDYVVRSVHKYRRAERGDRAGVIVFGREAAIEIPPFDDDIPVSGSFESFLECRDATNLEAALKLAQASFPEDTAKRIVIVTDGNENLGNARIVAPALANNGIGIDIVPVRLTTRAEVAVEKITIPPDLRRGTPFEVRTILNNFMAQDVTDDNQTVQGKLRVTRTMGDQEELVGEDDVQLPPGKTVVGFTHKIDKPAMYTYRATFVPTDRQDDLMSQNNEASTFTHVRGKGRVLFIEDCDHLGEFDYMVERLRVMNLEIDVQPSDQLFTSLAELQGYDCVVLANVPRSSGGSAADVSSFRDEQIQMLVRNTEQMGAGLVMIGGPNSFGAGGWSNTELEKAMPIDFQIKNAKVQAVGALVLLMHASEMARGNHWQKVVAREAIKSLGPSDYCGLLHWDNAGGDSWLWGGQQGLIKVEGKKETMMGRLNMMNPGDMPAFEPAMKMALAAFNRVPASVKHMIMISDGDPVPPFPPTVAAFKNANVKISTVAIGTHGPPGSTPLQNIASTTGGSYYVVTNPRALPKIYQREARKVSRPLVKDLDNVRPNIVYPHEILQGIEGPLPPIEGMVLSTVKNNPLVEVGIRSPVPADPANSTILATWTYGLGRTAVVTTDGGHRWASSWTEWPSYDKFYSQLIRWAMRPSSDQAKYTVSSDVRDGKVRVVITALNPDDEFRNFLNMTGAAVGPDLEPFEFKIEQQAAGRYVGEFDAADSGSYHLTIIPDPGEPPIRSGVNVPYSAEYRDRESNTGLMETLVSLQPVGGQPGKIIGQDVRPAEMESLLQVDTFREDLPRAISVKDIWPLLLLFAAGVFFGDVFIRRVSVGSDWVWPAIQWVKQRVVPSRDAAAVEQSLQKLRSRKAQVTKNLEQRHAATRFEPALAEERDVRELDDVLKDVTTRPETSRPASSTPADTTEGESYTDRLLKAKKRARDERK
jgi:uncharacterized membrane protein